MRGFARRTATRVRHGRVLPSNRNENTPTYWNTRQPELVIDVERPGRDHRHVVRKQHVERFVELIPGWDELSAGLDAVVLARGDWRDGWYSYAGVIGICAWERAITIRREAWYIRAHAGVFERLGVAVEGERVLFTEGTARAFLLLHVFLHELGHHVDRSTTRSQRRCARGEAFAEAFALEMEERVRDAYFRYIGLD
jgi:hypothetical protein